VKAEALHLAYRTSEALEAIIEAERVVERSEERWWSAELYRLRGLFLAAIGAGDAEIENLFCAAIRTAQEQKSISLLKARKQPTQNIAGKKRAHQEDVDFDYLFANSSSFLPSQLGRAAVRVVGLVSASSANSMQLFDLI
jgi:hypothetical protein